MSRRVAALTIILLGLGAGQADAQYYARPYGYGYAYAPPGSQCDAFLRTPFGPRRVLCPMRLAKPVGARCACPPPDPYGPTAYGRVIP